jgi:hypothetical protein
VCRPILMNHSSLKTKQGFCRRLRPRGPTQSDLDGTCRKPDSGSIVETKRDWFSRNHTVTIVVCAITLRISLQLEAGWSSAMLQPVMNIPAAWRVGPELACLTRPTIYYHRYWPWQRSNYSEYGILVLATHTTSTWRAKHKGIAHETLVV